MNRRIGLLVLAALCAVAFSAVGASGASAKGITAFTCVKVATNTGEFKNAHCNLAAKNDSETKDWSHVAIAQDETTQLTLAAIGTPMKLKTKIAGSSVTLEATEGLECVECHITNVVEGGAMTVTGSGGKLTYKGVTINVSTCKVAGGMITTEPMKLSVAMTEEAGPILGTISPVTGTTVAVLHLEQSGAEKCALGESITVTGHATGKATGGTEKFETGAGELLIGTQKAELIGEVTLSGGPTGAAHSPISATTTAT